MTLEQKYDGMTNGEVIESLFPNVGKNFSNIIDLNLWWNAKYKTEPGHWIIKDRKEQGYDIAGVKTWYIQIMCDKCGFINTAIEGHTGQYKFCPNCGIKMAESEEKRDE